MRSLDPADKRAFNYRKTIPKTGRVRDSKNGLDRNASMKKSSAQKAGYRSGFELNLAKSLVNNNVSFEYESEKLSYVPKPRVYTPDFYLPEHGIYIEAKGYFDKSDRVKMQLIKEQYPDLDIRLVFLNARNKIYKGSKTSYGDWANRYNFEWAEKNIPADWYKKNG